MTSSHPGRLFMPRWRAWLLATAAALLPTAGHAQPEPQNAIVYRVPMSCSAHALLEADRYPEALRIFDDWQALESFEQAERTLHGLAWRRRSQYARLVAKHEFERVVGRVPTHGELANAIFVWKQRLQDYSPGMREVFRQQCNPLFEEANRWAEEHRGPLPERLDMP